MPRASRPVRPRLELLEDRCVPANIPVLFVPGQPASFPTAALNPDPAQAAIGLEEFFLNLGTHPTDLTSVFEVDLPGLSIVSPTNSLVAALENVGYVQGVDLFVAAQDWRMPVAPLDGSRDGTLERVTAPLITDGLFEYGVDYVGYWLVQAAEAWDRLNPGVPLPGVNIISHSEGHLLTRAYIDAAGYGGTYINAQGKAARLPTVLNWISLAGPNEGASGIYNLLQDNFRSPLGRDPEGGLYYFLEPPYQSVLDGKQVAQPGGRPPINLASITDPATGQPDPRLFVQQYIPSLRDEMATYAFLDGRDVNGDPAVRNDLLLDLNGGPDRNGFASRCTFTAIYGTRRFTLTTASTQFGRVGLGLSLADGLGLFGRDEVWYRDGRRFGGDTLVPLASLVSSFAGDPRITLLPQNRVAIDHSGTVTDPKIQDLIIGILFGSGTNSTQVEGGAPTGVFAPPADRAPDPRPATAPLAARAVPTRIPKAEEPRTVEAPAQPKELPRTIEVVPGRGEAPVLDRPDIGHRWGVPLVRANRGVR